MTKASVLQQMLSAPEGATLAALSEATGWQAHTVRAALTRLRQAGHAVERSRSETGETVYRIRPAEGTAAETTVEETAVHGTTQTLGEAAAGGEPPTSAETSAA